MQESNKEFYSLGDVVKQTGVFIRYHVKRWWLFLLFMSAGIGSGIAYYTMQKPKYDAVCTFIVEEQQSSMGGLSSIASQFGFDIGGISGGGSIFAGDNILDILKSRKIVQQVLLSRMEEGEYKNRTLADVYLMFTGIQAKWKDIPALSNINYSGSSGTLSNVQDSVLNIIYEKLILKDLASQRINKKGTIIKVQVTSENGQFAKLMTERLVDAASKMYLNIKTGTAQANIERMQRRSDSLLALLNRKSYFAAVAQPLDANPGLKAAIVPTEIATRDKAVIATLYTEVTKNLEAGKLLLSQQTPVIQLLDTPGQSFYDHKKSLLFLVVVGALIGGFTCFMIISLLYIVKGVLYPKLSDVSL